MLVNVSKQGNGLKGFLEACLIFLGAIAPRAKNKGLQQAIMIRSKLRNKFLRSRSFSDKSVHNKQRNASVSLIR